MCDCRRYSLGYLISHCHCHLHTWPRRKKIKPEPKPRARRARSSEYLVTKSTVTTTVYLELVEVPDPTGGLFLENDMEEEDEYEMGEKPKVKPRWSREQLRAGATLLSLQTGTNRHASQKGMTGFGSPRSNIYITKDKGYIDPEQAGEDILRPQLGTNRFASQKGQTAMGATRNTITKVSHNEELVTECDKHSNTTIPMQYGTNKFASQGNGEVVIGSKRNTKTRVYGRMPRDRKAEMMIPFQSGTNIFASQAGMVDPPGVGAFRQAITEVEGLNVTEEELREGSLYVPWTAGSNQFASQKGSGGFMKVRDVLTKMMGGRELPEPLMKRCEEIIRLQSGTNRFASRKGMTDYGTPRNVVAKPKWKQEWLEEWEAAEEEWEESGRGHQVDQERMEYYRNMHPKMSVAKQPFLIREETEP